MIRAFAAVVLLTAVLAPSVAAHGDGGARGYRSAVTALRPAAAGLSVEVLDFDDRLHLENDTGEEVVVFGYEGEPYLRFDDDGVWRNTRSPATYLNDDRYGAVVVPDEADAAATPSWEHLSDGDDWEWHDHRIHWMSQIDPPVVRNAPDVPHHVFDWEVPGTIDGRDILVAGRLDYEPVDAGGRPAIVYLAAPFALIALAAAIVGYRRRAGGQPQQPSL